jgi:hypothetical protein
MMNNEEKHIVLLFVGTFLLAVINQAYVKTKIFAEYKAKDKTFDRWANKDINMVSADRLLLNLVEWSGVWCLLFFANVLANGEISDNAGM